MKNLLSTFLLLFVVQFSFGQRTLPEAQYRFKGNVATTYKDSDPAKFPQPPKPPENAPNILLILLDDVGFGQFAVSGGGVPSPNMEKLAHSGILYNRFHTTAVCSSSRAALLTGRNHHTAGSGNITELATGYEGYTGIIPQSTATIGEILKQNGYSTAWIGKNHNSPVYETSPIGPFNHQPNGFGFEYFYGFNAGDINQVMPTLMENTNPIILPEDSKDHLSTILANKTIEYLQQAEAFEPSKPWFLYLAPAATHSPHQAPKEWIDKFKGKFDMGWDKYREETFARQKKLGVVPQNSKLTERPKSIPAWSSVPKEQQGLYSHMMEIFAGYGAQADYEVGRVLDYVQTLPDAKNTMIIYIVGDNGASAEGGFNGTMNEMAFFNGHVATFEEVNAVKDELGTEKHFNHFPAQWAWAMNTPFQWTKQVASHLGGVRNPLIISYPDHMSNTGSIRDQFTHITDIVPTILDVVGIQEPDMVNGVPQKPMEGTSFKNTLKDPKAKETHTMQYFEMFCNRGMYLNGWWAGSLAFEPWQPERSGFDPMKSVWELYDLNSDFTQANNLAKSNPEKLEELKALWWAQASIHNVLPLDWRGSERFSSEITGKPNPSAGKDHFEYPYAMFGLPEAVAPDLKNKSFTVTADIDVKENADGMIFTQGGNTAGWAFYLKEGTLNFTHNYMDVKRYIIKSTSKITAGKHNVKVTFDYSGAPKELGKGGKATLYVDGNKAGEGQIDKTTPMKYSLNESQDIGLDLGTPVDENYHPPFKFQGSLTNIHLDLKK